jgi:DNA-binding MarR family transcriptional regulator/GNAT superfamily N-acetyltransferase
MAELLDDHVAAVRAFTRRWSEVTTMLNSGMYDTPYSLTEGRVIYELGQRDAVDLRDLRLTLGLDASYLTRIVRRFRSDGLVDTQPSTQDGRRQVLRLTAHGRAVAKLLDERSQEQNRELLAPLAEADRQRLVQAMTTIRAVIDGAPAEAPRFRLRGVRPGELGWVIARHGAVYAAERDWNVDFEAAVAQIVADYLKNFVPGKDNGWIAEADGEPIGSVLCGHDDEWTARLRLLLVEPAGRGMGVGAGLVRECVRFAAAAGYRRMVLETVSELTAARRIYAATGFTLEQAQSEHRYGHELVVEQWGRDLA